MRFILSAVLLSVLAWPIPAQGIDARPNIVFILADDFGYECVGANGGTSYKTPEIDKLANTGVRFEHCYTTGAFFDISKDILEENPITDPSPEEIQVRDHLRKALDQFKDARPALSAR